MSALDPNRAMAAKTSAGPSGASRAMWGLAARLLAALRDPNPILVKDLRATFRTALFVRFLYLSTGLVALIVLSGGAMVAGGNMAPSDVGKVVFQIFFTVALFVIALVAPAYAATTFTSEREQRTYEPLLLSGMPPHRIVWGKFLATYASITLVMVAQLPVAGIAFLFGGVSPSNVVFGYAWLQLVLAPAIALGIAISARLSSTRLAIVLATVMFMPTALVVTTTVTAFGEVAGAHWGTGTHGPFWFAEVLATRFFERDAFLLLVVVPVWSFLVPAWFLLATAVAAVRPPAEDRSTPLKVWGIVSALGTSAIFAFAVTLPQRIDDRGELGVSLAALAGGLLILYALLLTDEPPLPPRSAEQRGGTLSPLRRVWLWLGPGAAPTLRFSYLLIVLFAAGASLVPAAVRRLSEPSSSVHLRFDAALLVLAVGNASVAIALCGLAAFLRAMLRNGLAARVLALAALMAATIGPLTVQLVHEPRAFDQFDHRLPALVRLTPVAPTILAFQVATVGPQKGRLVELVSSVVPYGLLGVLFWVLVETRVRVVHRAVAQHRARQLERAREADERRAAAARARAAAAEGWPNVASTPAASGPESPPGDTTG
jgi:hypothetical protein